MHSNVVQFQRRQTRIEREATVGELFQEVKAILTAPRGSEDADLERQSHMLKELDELSSDMLVRKLALVHARQAAERAWTAEEEAIAAELEAAAYLAYRHGVPEEAIYDLNDESLSEALNSAMRKVANA